MTIRPRSFRALHPSSLVCMAMLFVASVAMAEPTELERTQAQRLFDEAMQLMQAEQYRAACPKFEESQRLAPAIGNQFNMAECYEKTGRIASAWLHFTQVADAARERGQTEREQIAQERAKQVEPRLSFVRIKLTSPSPGMTLHCDLTEIAQNLWGTPMPLDAGKHVIVARAASRLAWSKAIDVVGEGVTVEVEVPALVVTPRVGPLAPTLVGRDAQSSAWPFASRRLWALVSAGVGVAGLGVGTALVVAAEHQHSKAAPYCKGSECWDRRGMDAMHDARSLGNWANLPFGVGLAGLGLGAALWFTGPSSGAEQAKTSLRVSPSGLLMEGGF